MPEVLRPAVRVTIDGAVPARLQVDLLSSADGLRAAILLPARAPVHEVDALVEVHVGETLMLRGPIHTTEPIRRRMRRYLAEPLAQQVLRGRVPDEVGPFSRRLDQARAIAREVLAGLPHDVRAMPDVEVRWSSPRAPRRWVLDALLAATSAAAGVQVHATVTADGTVMLGTLDDLRVDSGVSLRTGETVLRRRGDRFLTIAVPAAWNTSVQLDGSPLLCTHARLDARAGRYRSHLVLAEAA